MYVLNKIVGGLLNPVALTLVLLLAGTVCCWLKRRRTALGLLAAAFVWLWLWGTAAWHRVVGPPLEREFTVVRAEDLPPADAIVVLGGGIHANPAVYPYPDIDAAADRVWHAARLYHAGKAPLVIPTGRGDRDAAVPLLRDLGVPETAITVENEARNTEENARRVAELLAEKATARRPRILLVTSAYHMRRSLLMYRRYAPGLEIVPAAADYVARIDAGRPLRAADFFPNGDELHKNCSIFKELVGYWGYRLLRR